MIAKISRYALSNNMTCTVGGSISRKTIEHLRNRAEPKKAICKLETRKVVLPTDMMLAEGAIQQALKFEQLYILSKKAFSELFIESEVSRLTQLKGRE